MGHEAGNHSENQARRLVILIPCLSGSLSVCPPTSACPGTVRSFPHKPKHTRPLVIVLHKGRGHVRQPPEKNE